MGYCIRSHCCLHLWILWEAASSNAKPLSRVSLDHIPGQGGSVLPPLLSWHVLGQWRHNKPWLTSGAPDARTCLHVYPCIIYPGAITRLKSSKVLALPFTISKINRQKQVNTYIHIHIVYIFIYKHVCIHDLNGS